MQTVFVKHPSSWTNKNNLLHLSSSQNLSLRSLNRHIFNNKLQACCIFFEKFIMANNWNRRVAAQVLLPVDLWWLEHFWPVSFLFYPFYRWKPYSCCTQLYPQPPHPPIQSPGPHSDTSNLPTETQSGICCFNFLDSNTRRYARGWHCRYKFRT